MEESIRSKFGLKGKAAQFYSPLTLAYIGDSVYELVLRTVVVGGGERSPKELHRAGAELAKAQTQARMITALQPHLTEGERAIYKRGRNAHPATTAKHAATGDYRRATGFEALMGYLYLSGQEERLIELIQIGWEEI